MSPNKNVAERMFIMENGITYNLLQTNVPKRPLKKVDIKISLLTEI